MDLDDDGGAVKRESVRVGPQFQAVVPATPATTSRRRTKLSRHSDIECLWSPSCTFCPPSVIEKFVQTTASLPDHHKFNEVNALAILRGCNGDVFAAQSALPCISTCLESVGSSAPSMAALCKSVISLKQSGSCSIQAPKLQPAGVMVKSLLPPNTPTATAQQLYVLATAWKLQQKPDALLSSLAGVSSTPRKPWSADEAKLFTEMVVSWGKGDFGRISREMRTRTTKEVVEYYYNTWRGSEAHVVYRRSHPKKDPEDRQQASVETLQRSWFHLWREVGELHMKRIVEQKGDGLWDDSAAHAIIRTDIDNEPFCAFCGDSGDIVCCEGECRRSYHVSCLRRVGDQLSVGAPEDRNLVAFRDTEASDEWLCYDCRSRTFSCFLCGGRGMAGRDVVSCQRLCGKYYHLSCVSSQPLARFWLDCAHDFAPSCGSRHLPPEKFVCSFHTCKSCLQGFDAFHPKAYYRCHLCPTVYHAECLPDGIVYEMAEVIECPGPHPNAAFHYRINSSSKLTAALALSARTSEHPSPDSTLLPDPSDHFLTMPVLSSKRARSAAAAVPTASTQPKVEASDSSVPVAAPASVPNKRTRKRRVDVDVDEWLSDLDALSDEDRQASRGAVVMSPIAALASVASHPRRPPVPAVSAVATAKVERQVSGPLFFGYGIPSVQGVIRSLPQASLVLPFVNEKFRDLPVPSGDPSAVPCRVGINLVIDSFGDIAGYSHQMMFSERYVIPVGFKSRRKLTGLPYWIECSTAWSGTGLEFVVKSPKEQKTFRSSSTASKYAMAHFTAGDDRAVTSPKGGTQPVAPVVPSEISKIPLSPLYRETRKRGGNVEGVIRRRTQTVDVSVSGPQFFGFGDPNVQAMMAALPNASIILERGILRSQPKPVAKLPRLPSRLGKNVTICSLGVIPTMPRIAPLLHEKYILSDGYYCVKTLQDVRGPDFPRDKYHCRVKIDDHTGKLSFSIEAQSSGKVFTAASASGAAKLCLEAIRGSRTRESQSPASTSAQPVVHPLLAPILAKSTGSDDDEDDESLDESDETDEDE